MKKARYIGNTEAHGLTKDHVYDVLSIEHGWFRIVDPFLQEDYLYPPDLFELIED